MIINEITNINPRTLNGSTPFHAAAEEGHLEICQKIMGTLVIRNSTDFHPKDDKGWTPLHAAATKGHLEICLEIVHSLISNNVTDVNPRDCKGWTPLHVAAVYGFEAIWRLIATAIVKQKQQGHLGICETTFCSTVIKNFSNFNNLENDVNPKDNEGSTPLHFAAAQGQVEVCHLIIFGLIVDNTDVIDINPRD